MVERLGELMEWWERPTAMPEDQFWMNRAGWVALDHPRDMPFGCVIVSPAGIEMCATWGTGHPLDPTEHSEIQAIQEVCRRRGDGDLLKGYSIYSTHQPCCMCAGAIAHSKLSRVVFGSYRSDVPHMFKTKQINCEDILAEAHPRPIVIGGVSRRRCISLFDGVEKRD